MNLVQDGHIISSPQGMIHMANQQATHLFHKDEGSLVGRPLSQFVSESDWPVILEHMSKLGAGRTQLGMGDADDTTLTVRRVLCPVSFLGFVTLTVPSFLFIGSFATLPHNNGPILPRN